jgi:dipeptidyl-peptidase-4
MLKLKTSDGLFDMPAIITFPVNFDETKKYPVVFTIYGGPNSKNITSNRWQGEIASWYAQNGIITFTVDHRGSGHFGKKGLDYLYRSLGKWEILDYEDAVKWLLSKPYVDGTRMGITGSSYGGYMTCLALTKGADFWTHGFAGSSVTDYRLYDNIYTERYMRTPQENPNGYDDNSPVNHTDKIKGNYLIIHGTEDDNVHFQNATQMITALVKSNIDFESAYYPNKNHNISGAEDNTSFHLWNKMTKWILANLGNENVRTSSPPQPKAF